MNDNSLAPIIINHAACSGGSVIFRTIAKRLQLCGISEISHVLRPPGKVSFYPLDPEYLLYLNAGLDSQEFLEVFSDRVSSCYRRSAAKGHRLLLREHTHSMWFLATSSPPDNSGYSWIVDRQDELFHVPCPSLISTRDPVDSWLGLCASFPHLAAYSFDEYCQRYNRWLDKTEEYKKKYPNSILQFKYEDFIDDVETTLQEIAEFTGQPLGAGGAESENAVVVSTGNSGRSTSSLSRRPRRKFSIGFLNAAEASAEYAKLCERLGYPHCAANLTTKDRFQARLNSVTKYFVSNAKSLLNQIKKQGKKAAIAD